MCIKLRKPISIYRIAVEANQVLSADLAQATSSADTKIENEMGSLVSTINGKLGHLYI